MTGKAYERRMYCENCSGSWLQSIPIGYLISEDPNGRPQIRKEEGTDIKKDFRCPVCGTKSKIRWD